MVAQSRVCLITKVLVLVSAKVLTPITFWLVLQVMQNVVMEYPG